jgi:hypothetical protein
MAMALLKEPVGVFSVAFTTATIRVNIAMAYPVSLTDGLGPMHLSSECHELASCPASPPHPRSAVAPTE